MAVKGQSRNNTRSQLCHDLSPNNTYSLTLPLSDLHATNEKAGLLLQAGFPDNSTD